MGGSRFLSIQHCAGYQLTPLFLFQMVMLKGTGGGRVFQMHWIFNKRGCFCLDRFFSHFLDGIRRGVSQPSER